MEWDGRTRTPIRWFHEKDRMNQSRDWLSLSVYRPHTIECDAARSMDRQGAGGRVTGVDSRFGQAIIRGSYVATGYA